MIMPAAFGDRAIDFGLSVFSNESTSIAICSAEPSTIDALATYMIGYKHFGPGQAFGPPMSAVSPSGRSDAKSPRSQFQMAL
jgi:hypothetical protein